MAKSSGLAKSLHTFPDQSGAGVNHAGQNLDKRCPGFDFIFGVFTGQNTADTDNGNGIAQFGLELADDMRGQVSYRSTGKSSGFLSVFEIIDSIAGDGGIGRDDAVDFMAYQGIGNVFDLAVVYIPERFSVPAAHILNIVATICSGRLSVASADCPVRIHPATAAGFWCSGMKC